MNGVSHNLRDFKKFTFEAAFDISIPIYDLDMNVICRLVPVGEWILRRPQLIEKITKWRNANLRFYLHQTPVNHEDTVNFLRDKIHFNSSSLLFMIYDCNRNYVGQISFSNVSNKKVQLDNVLLGEKTHFKNFMNFVDIQCLEWLKAIFIVEEVWTYVLSYNLPGINLHLNSNFRLIENISLKSQKSQKGLTLVFCKESDSDLPFTCLLMKIVWESSNCSLESVKL